MVPPLELLEQRAKDAVKGQLRSAQAKVQRETSIVRLAGACLKAPVNKLGKKKKFFQSEPQPGVYAQSTLDGYLRRSPVQEIRTAPNYRAVLIKRGIAAAVAVVVIAAVAAVLLRVL